MRTHYLAATAVLLSLVPAQALASPAIRWVKAGSSILAYATNGEKQSYSCSGELNVGYDDFGTRKSRSESVNFAVQPESKDVLVYTYNTTWPGSSLTFSPSISCT